MSHFAKVVNGVVTQVIVAEQDVIDDRDGQWVQTSYNTRGGVHYAPNSNDPDGGIALRKNYAGIGYIYDIERDAFMEAKDPKSGLVAVAMAEIAASSRKATNDAGDQGKLNAAKGEPVAGLGVIKKFDGSYKGTNVDKPRNLAKSVTVE